MTNYSLAACEELIEKYTTEYGGIATELDTVIFRKDSHGVFAIFPYIIADTRGSVTTYQHVGQHSAGAYDVCINSSKPATEEEYQDLKEELESMGYNLKIGKQRHWETYIKALRICQGY